MLDVCWLSNVGCQVVNSSFLLVDHEIHLNNVSSLGLTGGFNATIDQTRSFPD